MFLSPILGAANIQRKSQKEKVINKKPTGKAAGWSFITDSLSGKSLLTEGGELDVLRRTVAQLGVRAGSGEEGPVVVRVALAGGDDGLEVLDLRVLAADAGGGLVELAGQDVGEDAVVAAAGGVGELGGSLGVVAMEDVDDALVGLFLGIVVDQEPVVGGIVLA